MALDLQILYDPFTRTPAAFAELVTNTAAAWQSIWKENSRYIEAFGATTNGQARMASGSAAGQTVYLGGTVATHADACIFGNFQRASSLTTGEISWYLRGTGSDQASFNAYQFDVQSFSGAVCTPRLRRVVGGVGTTLISGSNFTPSTNTDIAFNFQVVGNVLTVTYNGGTVLTYTDTDGAAILTPGRAGIRGNQTNASGNAFIVKALTANQESSGIPVPVSFVGPVSNQSAFVGVPFSLNLTSFFSGSLTPFTYSLFAGSLSGTGLTLSAGVITGTPSGAATISGLVVRATDTGSNVANSNSFTIFVTAPDTTAPVLTAATGVQTGGTTATVGATTDEGNGTMFLVVTTSATQPSVAQIKDGKNNGGTAATWAGSLSISTTGAKTTTASGLTAATTYYTHAVQTDAAGNDSNRVVSASFATSSAITYGFKLSTVSGAIMGNFAGALTNNLGLETAGNSWSLWVMDDSTNAQVAALGPYTVSASGRLPDVSHAAIGNAVYFLRGRRTDGAFFSARMQSVVVP